MSDENVELVLETVRRFTPGDLDAWAELWHPDTRMDPPDGWPEPGPFVGLDAVRAQFDLAWGDVWQNFRIEDVELVAAEGEWVVVTYRLHAQGAASGIDAEFELAGAYRVQKGLVSEFYPRWNTKDALEVAGLTG
jgi:hypothetical protein